VAKSHRFLFPCRRPRRGNPFLSSLTNKKQKISHQNGGFFARPRPNFEEICGGRDKQMPNLHLKSKILIQNES